MAKRDFVRSYFEGGHSETHRIRSRKRERRFRAAERAYCLRLRGDPEWFDHQPTPVREPVDGWDDPSRHSMGVASRWFAAQVGRPFADVFAEMRQQYDRRTYAAYLMKLHLEGYVCPGTATNSSADCLIAGADHYVDADGILRREDWWYPRRRYEKMLPFRAREERKRTFTAWLDGRRIGKHGATWYWFVPTERCTTVFELDAWVATGGPPGHWRDRVPTYRYRQGNALTAEEFREFTDLLAGFTWYDRAEIEKRYVLTFSDTAKAA